MVRHDINQWAMLTYCPSLLHIPVRPWTNLRGHRDLWAGGIYLFL
jgi:hypothetical protein